MSYKHLHDFDEEDINRLLVLLRHKSYVGCYRLKVVDQWDDDNEQCVDVHFIHWPQEKIKCSIWWLSKEQAAAFYFSDDPKAKEIIIQILERCLSNAIKNSSSNVKISQQPHGNVREGVI